MHRESRRLIGGVLVTAVCDHREHFVAIQQPVPEGTGAMHFVVPCFKRRRKLRDLVQDADPVL
jgi:hypothetical protein